MPLAASIDALSVEAELELAFHELLDVHELARFQLGRDPVAPDHAVPAVRVETRTDGDDAAAPVVLDAVREEYPSADALLLFDGGEDHPVLKRAEAADDFG